MPKPPTGFRWRKALVKYLTVPADRKTVLQAKPTHARLGRVMFWVPTPCLRSIGVSVLSYAGQINVCFNSDAHAVPDLDVMMAAYEAERLADPCSGSCPQYDLHQDR